MMFVWLIMPVFFSKFSKAANYKDYFSNIKPGRYKLENGFNNNQIIDKLTNIGLEVESVENLSADNQLFKVAKIVKTEKHPNADRLKVCDVNVGEKDLKKVVCGAANAKEGLITIYAPPGAVIPKTKFELKIAKISSGSEIINISKSYLLTFMFEDEDQVFKSSL